MLHRLMINSAFAPLWGLQWQCFSFRGYTSYIDYSRALMLLANFKAHLLLGLSLPFSTIPPAAAGVFPRLRESQTTRSPSSTSAPSSPTAASARSPPPPRHLQLLHRARRHRSRRPNAKLVHDSGRQTAAFQHSQRLQLLLKGEARALS